MTIAVGFNGIVGIGLVGEMQMWMLFKLLDGAHLLAIKGKYLLAMCD
jgi:hypothetical protein